MMTNSYFETFEYKRMNQTVQFSEDTFRLFHELRDLSDQIRGYIISNRIDPNNERIKLANSYLDSLTGLINKQLCDMGFWKLGNKAKKLWDAELPIWQGECLDALDEALDGLTDEEVRDVEQQRHFLEEVEDV
jgi:hypothetical protein